MLKLELAYVFRKFYKLGMPIFTALMLWGCAQTTNYTGSNENSVSSQQSKPSTYSKQIQNLQIPKKETYQFPKKHELRHEIPRPSWIPKPNKANSDEGES